MTEGSSFSHKPKRLLDAKPFQGQFQSMAALGRPFKVGDIYAYHQDRILSGIHIWKQAALQAATRTQFQSEVRLLSAKHSDFIINSKWDLMGLDQHLQVSIMAGVIETFQGASNYANDSSNPALVTQTLACSFKSRGDILDLESLVSRDKPHLHCSNEDGKEEATHVVVGVSYGAEVYCVLTNDLDGDGESKEKMLHKFTTEWKNSLEKSQDLIQFQEKFDQLEKKQLSQMKCQIYSDFLTESVREDNVFDAYKRCLILTDHVQNSGKELVPIAVLLCPLDVIMGAKETKQIECFDVDADLVSRCYRVMDKLDRIRFKVDALLTGVKLVHRPRLRRFADAIAKYQEILKKNLKDAVIDARKSNDIEQLEKIAKVAENHLLFRPSRLKRWLYYEEAEIEMTEKFVTGTEGITFVAAGGCEEFDQNFELILYVPSLNEMKIPFIGEMENIVEENDFMVDLEWDDDDYSQDGDTTEDEEETGGTSFQHVEFRRRILQSKLKELTDHINRNKGIENRIKIFLINDRDQEIKPCYVLCDYTEDQENPTKTLWFQLPKPPTNLRISPESTDKSKKAKTSLKSVSIEWDQSDQDQMKSYPNYYVVEFRPKGSIDYWERKKTGDGQLQATICTVSGTAVEFRVASGNITGLSDFSDVVYSDSLVEVEEIEILPRKKSQPQVTNVSAAGSTVLPTPTGLGIGLVTQTSAEIEWDPTTTIPSGNFFHVIRFRRSGTTCAVSRKASISKTYLRLEGLMSNTIYIIDLLIVSCDGTMSGPPSQPIELTTLEDHLLFPETISKWSHMLENGGEMSSYAIPLSQTDPAVHRYAFGRPAQRPKWNNTILLVGASGSGKTSLINGILNYVFGVKWKDLFRFQLDDGPTESVKVYDIHNYEGFKVNCSLTIVDTPGYGEDLAKNQEITNMIRTFFEENEGEQQMDSVGFVVNSTQPNPTATDKFIYESMTSIFGEDVGENSIHLLTFADKKEDPPLLSAIKENDQFPHCKFDNSAFFSNNKLHIDDSDSDSSEEDDAEKYEKSRKFSTEFAYKNFLWNANQNNLRFLFKFINSTTYKSLSSSRKLVEETTRIVAAVDGLENLIRIGLMKMEELRTIRQNLTNQEDQIGGNVEFQLNVALKKKLVVPYGQFLTNCINCNITCHQTCGSANEKAECDIMDHSKPISVRTCRVCPDNCMWTVHASQPFRWEHVQQKETTSAAAIKEKYEEKLKRKLTAAEFLMELDLEIKGNERAVLGRFDAVVEYNKRLDEMSKGETSLTTLQIINQRIVGEKKEKSDGFDERIKSLKSIRLLHVINYLNSIESNATH